MKKAKQPGSPKPSEIKAARLRAGLTQAQAAKLVGVTIRTWQNWEHGTVPMRAGLWDLFLIKSRSIQRSGTG